MAQCISLAVHYVALYTFIRFWYIYLFKVIVSSSYARSLEPCMIVHLAIPVDAKRYSAAPNDLLFKCSEIVPSKQVKVHELRKIKRRTIFKQLTVYWSTIIPRPAEIYANERNFHGNPTPFFEANVTMHDQGFQKIIMYSYYHGVVLSEQ